MAFLADQRTYSDIVAHLSGQNKSQAVNRFGTSREFDDLKTALRANGPIRHFRQTLIFQ
jgi:hypothetical protein